MKKGKNKFIYILSGIIIIALLFVLIYIKSPIYKEKEQQKAIKQTEQYLTETYQDLNYEILSVDSSRHYGYFEHAVTVQNTETNETFDVFYDKNMDRMEDSIKLEKTEQYLTNEIQPKIEKYIEEHFGETKYITASYYMETGKPLIVVTFNENHKDITQTEYDTFVAYLENTLGIDHANVIVDYWNRALTFNKDY